MEGCEFFNIPEYQRGYKWTVDNIVQLLEDLKGFKQNTSDEFYCLQNITLTKTNVNEHLCFNVIDGQQRLTTLFILISYLQRNMRDKVLSAESDILRYSIREETDKFLRESILSGDFWTDKEYTPATKDQYYILRKSRNDEANQLYVDMLEEESDGLYIQDIMRGGIKNDDPRIPRNISE